MEYQDSKATENVILCFENAIVTIISIGMLMISWWEYKMVHLLLKTA